MSDQSTSASNPDDINDGIGTYDVVILAEHEVSDVDAAQIHGLHAEIGDQVVYHVLIPLEDASARLEATLGSLGAGDMFAAPVIVDPIDMEEVRKEIREQADAELERSLAALRAAGARAHGRVITEAPVDALDHATTAVDAREAIVLTSPHLVQEFFHVDWTSRARRRVGVPVLHLLEHETFNEQGGSGEGVTGL